MKRAGLAVMLFASSVAIARAAPVDLLPPGFGETPAPTPAPSPAPTPTPTPAPSATSNRTVQPSTPPPAERLRDLPTLRELESLSTDELDELLGLRPRVDIPAASARGTDVIGVIGPEDDGLEEATFAGQPGSLVRAALIGNEGRYVSRWGHVLMRRALSSALRSPSGLDPVVFADLRAGLLNRMGEHAAARALVQSVDTPDYSPSLTQTAIEAYLGTGDVVGACPAVRLSRTERDDGEWLMLRAICNAYAGETTRANNDLRRLVNSGEYPRIDGLLAQRYAGAAGQSRRAVTIEWDEVDSLTRWRFALATALGETIPENLLGEAPAGLREQMGAMPSLSAPERLRGAASAARRGVLSSQALIDLYSEIAMLDGEDDVAGAETSDRLRLAFTGTGAERIEAMRALWNDEAVAGHIATATAAARIPPASAYADVAPDLLRSMVAAGYDRNAALWRDVVEGGSLGWGIVALASPDGGSVSDGDMSDFLDNDTSTNSHRSRMLFAGLAGLGRLEAGELDEYADRLDIDLARTSRWTRAIEAAGAVGNAGMVALLAGLGMQGADWSAMTALHLYHIVRALDAAGMNAEARMIAAEAVAQT